VTDSTNSAGRADRAIPLTATDYQVLLVLAGGDLYGYAIMKAVEEDSDGAVSLGIGSLYRILGRLETEGLVQDIPAPEGAPTEHRGRPRRYYRLTRQGRSALEAESLRLRSALEIARKRKLLPEGSG
jgi:DNA-binding PadR family transcriptional regulator